MPLMTTEKCWRGRTDCVGFDSIESVPENVTEEQLATLDFEPETFVCCGLIAADSRVLPQDAYRFCFKSRGSDSMSDNDEQDLTHAASVILRSLAVVATRRVNSGCVEVPTMQGQGEDDG
ncbi:MULTISPECIES: hypothetical protein [Methylosinus]|nr:MULTISPECIES: hypothetical protein [Methylosinus]